MAVWSYEITPRSRHLGGGWRLRLFDDGQEVGGGVFPRDAYLLADDGDALDPSTDTPTLAAYEDALAVAEMWAKGGAIA